MAKEFVSWGGHEVMLLRVIDLGSQKDFFNKDKLVRKIEFLYEVLDQQMEINWKQKNMWVSEIVNSTTSEKMTTKYHKKLNTMSWKNLSLEEVRNFDYSSLLGKVYIAQVKTYVSKKDWNTYSSVDSISLPTARVSQAFEWYVSDYEKFVFSFKNFSQNIFQKLAEFKRKQIEDTPEYKKLFFGN